VGDGHNTIPLPVGAVIGGKYTLARVIGAGGMGTVYEAYNSWTGRRVAIKVLLAEHAHRPEVIDRFTQEARATTQIAHPNIVDILDMGQDPGSGVLFIVQEFLDGMDLSQWLAQRGPYAPAEALPILLPVMGALVAAHRRGVIHRDLKPENIFLARGSGGTLVPKLIDFGISKFIDQSNQERSRTQTGMAVGTPQYMSPEQARGDRDVDARSDVWSMGVVLYEVLSGRPVFDAPNYNLLIVQVITQTPPRIETVAPAVPWALAEVLHRALEPDRERRFQSMHEFVGALIASTEEGGYAATEVDGLGRSGARAAAPTELDFHEDDAATRVELPPLRAQRSARTEKDDRPTLGGSQPTLTPAPWSGAAEPARPATNLAPRIAVAVLLLSIVIAAIIGGFVVGSTRGATAPSASLPVTFVPVRPATPAPAAPSVPAAAIEVPARPTDEPTTVARAAVPAAHASAPVARPATPTARPPLVAAPRRLVVPRPTPPARAVAQTPAGQAFPMVFPRPARPAPTRATSNNAPILGVE
jgi:serine/threonine-protein kinase